jgi:2-haloacid dehalogenase
MADIRAYVFDAYGTLFDVHSVVDAGRSVTSDPQTLSAVWRQKQLEYTWLRALMGRYEDFWAVTEAALRFALRKLELSATPSQIAALMESYLSLAAFPDVRAALSQIQDRPVAILSNGSPRMLESAVRSSGLAPLIRHVLSVDAVGTYKPSPAVYGLGPRALGVPAEQALFVSSNAWDVAGAKAFGYQVCWCNRVSAPPEELGSTPDHIIARLDQLPR